MVGRVGRRFACRIYASKQPPISSRVGEPKPEYRVRLHDLVLQELRLAIEQRDVADLEKDGSFDANEFNKRIPKYDALCESVARLFGILGRHGDGTEFHLVEDVLRTLTSVPSRGGSVLWIDMHKKYPAMLILFAYGLGALKAGRYKACFDVLTVSIPREHVEAIPSVEYLFLYPTFGSEVRCWNWLPGLEKARTPVSEHLLAKFSEWGTDYSLGRGDFESIYERFEFLGALAFLSSHSAEEIEQQVAINQTQSWVWTPMGRVSWHTQSLTSLLKEAASGAVRDQLLAAGFCRNDARHLDASLRNLSKIGSMARFGW